jgi:hypothetical protein
VTRRRLGVLGTFVWDVIHGRDARAVPLEEWGGITYALAAADAALPPTWEVVPLAKVGEDRLAHAREWLRGLRRLAPDAHPLAVPQPTNRVELRYLTAERRSEVLVGGVPPWTWAGLQPLVRDLDALYVNLISGFELDLATATLLRQHFRGPIYLDLHSLLLGVAPDGTRVPQPLADVAAWCRCADFVQVNEDELAQMAPDGLALAARAMAEGVRALVVTLGSQGAVYFTAPGFSSLDSPRAAADLGAIRTARVPAVPARVTGDGDPTGCGDVWGATCFSRLIAGDTFLDAVHTALRAAARNVEHRGATGLAHHLRGELSPT